jgi:hypothetical protein
MTGLYAQIIALLTTHHEGLTAAELTIFIRGGKSAGRDNAVNSALYRLKAGNKIEAITSPTGATYFLRGRVLTSALEGALKQWDVTASEKLREEYSPTSEAS